MSEKISPAVAAQSIQAPTEQTSNQGAPTNPGAEGAAEPRKPVSPGFAELARKEREFVKKQQQLAADREKFLQDKAEYDAWKAAKEKAKLNPAEYLEKGGLSYEEITQYYLNGEKPTPDAQVSEVKSEIERLRQEFAEKEKQALEDEKKRAAEAEAKAIEDFENSLNSFIDQNKDTYELTNLFGGQKLVMATIQEHFEKTQKIMSFEEASKLVEDHFEKEVERTAQSSKKFQSKYRPVESDGDPKEPGFHTPKTLSNQLTSSAVPTTLSAKTEADRLKRAMARLNGD